MDGTRKWRLRLQLLAALLVVLATSLLKLLLPAALATSLLKLLLPAALVISRRKSPLLAALPAVLVISRRKSPLLAALPAVLVISLPRHPLPAVLAISRRKSLLPAVPLAAPATSDRSVLDPRAVPGGKTRREHMELTRRRSSRLNRSI